MTNTEEGDDDGDDGVEGEVHDSSIEVFEDNSNSNQVKFDKPLLDEATEDFKAVKL
jgi:hypothetical protein